MCIRYGRVNGRTRRSAGKSRDGAGASEGRESRSRIIGRCYPKFPGWPSLVNSPAAVTGIEEAFSGRTPPLFHGGTSGSNPSSSSGESGKADVAISLSPLEDLADAMGEMDKAEFTAFLGHALRNLAAFSAAGSLHYICMDWRHLEEL